MQQILKQWIKTSLIILLTMILYFLLAPKAAVSIFETILEPWLNFGAYFSTEQLAFKGNIAMGLAYMFSGAVILSTIFSAVFIYIKKTLRYKPALKEKQA